MLSSAISSPILFKENLLTQFYAVLVKIIDTRQACLKCVILKIHEEETYYPYIIPFTVMIENRNRVNFSIFQLGAKTVLILPSPY